MEALLQATTPESEHDKSLSNVTLDSLLLNSQHVESNSLCKWSALTDSHDITDSGSGEHWGEVRWQVVMSLLKSIVFFDVMQVVSSQNYCSVHLIRKDHAPVAIQKIHRSIELRIQYCTYLKILPLMVTLEVNGHFLSTYTPFLASCGVLKPILNQNFQQVLDLSKNSILTETNFL